MLISHKMLKINIILKMLIFNIVNLSHFFVRSLQKMLKINIFASSQDAEMLENNKKCSFLTMLKIHKNFL